MGNECDDIIVNNISFNQDDDANKFDKLNLQPCDW